MTQSNLGVDILYKLVTSSPVNTTINTTYVYVYALRL